MVKFFIILVLMLLCLIMILMLPFYMLLLGIDVVEQRWYRQKVMTTIERTKINGCIVLPIRSHEFYAKESSANKLQTNKYFVRTSGRYISFN